MTRNSLHAVLAVVALHASAAAAATPAGGYVYSSRLLSEFTEGCVAEGPGGVFVGVGPLLGYPPSGGTRSIVFVGDGSGERTVATGLNAIGDCLYDAASDVLYVSDNGGDFTGAATGDTVFAIASAASAPSVAVAGHELVPAGSIPFASSLALLGDVLLVSDAAGSGGGSVRTIDLATAPAPLGSFASGLDYAGGLAVRGAEVLVAESRDSTFDNQIRRYGSSGTLLGLLSGPTYAHGSIDLALEDSGRVLVTGNDTLVAVDGQGAATPMVTGLDGGSGFASFGGGVSIQAASGRIDFAASSFSGADDDRSLHRLTPVAGLSAGRGVDATECVHEFYGVVPLVLPSGKPSRLATCQDGADCDADGSVNGSCTFPLGFCFNVVDARYPTCNSPGVASFELLRVKPEAAALITTVAEIHDAAPLAAAGCYFSDGIAVPLRMTKRGTYRPGRGLVKVRATLDEARGRRDADVVRLRCEPAAS